MSNHVVEKETMVQPLDRAFIELAKVMADSGDGDNASRLHELREKLTAGKLTVAFCGHFSAGKSTLVNRLCGTELLPSSPIPTSANVVSISNGKAKAILTRQSGGKLETLEVPLERLNEYAADGENVRSIALSYPIPMLGEHTVLLDTPGIDSTDDAHRMATESALHLADAVFYVMDYNHVQSEINFTFAKQLKEWGKPLYLIVNQIDKHREQELSFRAYQASVEEGFANWHLEPAGIVYLSLRKPDHPHNEWEKLKKLLADLAMLREPLSVGSVYDSARHLIREHTKRFEEQDADKREQLILAAGGEGEAQQVRSEIGMLEAKLSELSAEGDKLRVQLRLDVQSLLDNANVTPAATRDLAHTFLESRKPGFKAGLLFAGAKTAAEQARRLSAFREDFAAQAAAGIEWHLSDMLRKAADAVGWRDESLEEELKTSLHWDVEDQWLIDHVKHGAVFGNEYTMNYSRELAADLKGLYRKRAQEWIDALADRAAVAGEAAAAPVRARLAELGSQAAALAQLAALDQRAAAHRARLAALLPPAPPRTELPKPQAAGSGSAHSADAGSAGAAAAAAVERPAAGSRAAMPEEATPSSGTAADRSRETAPAAAALAQGDALAPQRLAAARLRQAADVLAPHEALQSSVRAMRDKADRLQRSRFTIALFGAFSAGKSSLANALLGDAVLPVSPNPTTAAVNRIVPPTDERPHGSASVWMKSKEAMIGDLSYSLALLGEDVTGLGEQQLIQAIGKLSPGAVHAGGRPHYSFLKAAANGWQEHEALLGQRLDVDDSDYRRYVAEESRSCFVSEIELYHDNPLTAQGIVLVDTPGADSVNARHTGVAFNYIKNADAILFVTYYNHAFSQADRQFLLQLGRVKDQFELDKMFFIVNAADLAASQEELQGVLAHVERNLQQHGIRFPRMFPVSSLAALEGKQSASGTLIEESGIRDFESAFLDFTKGDLGRLAVASAEQELERARHTIAGWLKDAAGDAATREAERALLSERAAAAKAITGTLMKPAANVQLEQELKELLFYVLQRIQFRFGDHYNFAFNPSTLEDDGRDLRKALWTSWLELQRLLQIELAQELEATSLRLDNTLTKLAAKKFADTAEETGKILEGFTPSAFPSLDLPSPDEQAPWQADTLETKWLWSRFKSPRQFFEGDGKAAMRKALEAELSDPLQGWLSRAELAWKERYAELWQATMTVSAQTLQGDIDAFVRGKQDSLSGSADVESLQQLGAALAAI
ncbi:dynamin family protein [Paenibacillus mendelii]|uniref:Dynamin family protein n=1 Tax=Paenibacillus mendelii TaxID=206163 RepID=A0ABV6J522_9BACL|nr:dynamin family protein [Paenibacillus mendelii]MCQ6560315.1 dynamin family protein [Paenibacillus mendelii]